MTLTSVTLFRTLLCAVLLLSLRTIRLVRLGGVYSYIYWTNRAWLWNYPVPDDYNAWFGSGKREQFEQDAIKFIRVWDFLRPFFLSHGYDLHAFSNPANISENLFPSLTSVTSTETSSFPYALCLYADKSRTDFMFHSLRVWSARDEKGRDVVIKAISGPTPTNELQALRLLHSDELRNDPQNHTIPVLEYLDFAGQIFVVMPRWDIACKAEFTKVGELIRFGQAFFESVAFLHKNGIGHGDISMQNMTMDLIAQQKPRFAGVRGPERRYALIDFETAKLGLDTSVQRSYSPKVFRDDIFRLAIAVEIHLRCIQDVLPALGPLFDDMKDHNDPKQPAAAAALSRYEEIWSTLSEKDMERDVTATRWRYGKTTYRTSPPLYYGTKNV